MIWAFAQVQRGAKLQPSRRSPVLSVDPKNPDNKMQIKKSITDAIAQQVTGSNREEIALRVEETYERILIGAAISAHVPSLTAGSVRREVIASMHASDKRVPKSR
jgi:hypothetical protein